MSLINGNLTETSKLVVDGSLKATIVSSAKFYWGSKWYGGAAAILGISNDGIKKTGGLIFGSDATQLGHLLSNILQ